MAPWSLAFVVSVIYEGACLGKGGWGLLPGKGFLPKGLPASLWTTLTTVPSSSGLRRNFCIPVYSVNLLSADFGLQSPLSWIRFDLEREEQPPGIGLTYPTWPSATSAPQCPGAVTHC